MMLIDWGTSDVVTLQSHSHLTQELAALQPVMGWFRLRGCGHAGVKDMQGLVDKEVLMGGIFDCYCVGQLVNKKWTGLVRADTERLQCLSREKTSVVM